MGLIMRLMNWDDGRATREFEWLKLMAAVKYDGYADFKSGVRFLENLITWIKQFEEADRPAAYEFIRRRLIYVSPAEMQQLVEAFFPEVVAPQLREAVAAKLKVPAYEAWATPGALIEYEIAKRKTLLVGMSDGSRIDLLRRANAKTLSTEQILPMMNIDGQKWRDLGKDLRKNLMEIEKDYVVDAKPYLFDRVYLIDDFTASGTTFIRQTLNDEQELVWKGKLEKFNTLVNRARDADAADFPLAIGYDLHIHHYISSDQARDALDERIGIASSSMPELSFGKIAVDESLRLPIDTKLDTRKDQEILDICDRYYDHSLFLKLEKHCREADMTHFRHGYADCALPVVLDHNTPNNSITLLWAKTEGKGGHQMEPLFARRDRHG